MSFFLSFSDFSVLHAWGLVTCIGLCFLDLTLFFFFLDGSELCKFSFRQLNIIGDSVWFGFFFFFPILQSNYLAGLEHLHSFESWWETDPHLLLQELKAVELFLCAGGWWDMAWWLRLDSSNIPPGTLILQLGDGKREDQVGLLCDSLRCWVAMGAKCRVQEQHIHWQQGSVGSNGFIVGESWCISAGLPPASHVISFYYVLSLPKLTRDHFYCSQSIITNTWICLSTPPRHHSKHSPCIKVIKYSKQHNEKNTIIILFGSFFFFGGRVLLCTSSCGL
jgi:hypothetical protein